MAGFKKSAVIVQLKARLAEQVLTADRQQEREVKSWEKEKDEIQRSKKNVRQAVRDLTDGKIEIEEFSKRVGGNRGRYEAHWLDYSRKTVAPKPKRKETDSHKHLLEKIALIEAYDGESLSVNEMKTVGVLNWIKG